MGIRLGSACISVTDRLYSRHSRSENSLARCISSWALWRNFRPVSKFRGSGEGLNHVLAAPAVVLVKLLFLPHRKCSPVDTFSTCDNSVAVPAKHFRSFRNSHKKITARPTDEPAVPHGLLSASKCAPHSQTPAAAPGNRCPGLCSRVWRSWSYVCSCGAQSWHPPHR